MEAADRTDAAATARAPEADGRVLSTLNRDGSRRWIRPKPSKGRYHRRRLVTAWALMVAFVAIPHLKMNGKPLMLFDIPRREFTLFGTTFLPTDTFLLMMLLFSIFVGIFLVTAVWGRVWCGWACPQTVYMEYLYRPLERLIEGGRRRQLELDRSGPDGKRALKYVVFLFLSAGLAHSFLAYFVGVEALTRWITQPPTEHTVGFAVMLGTTLLMFFDFAYFREQTCIVACPYGRFQSVLLDRQSLIVGYDARRGEPRGKLRKRRSEDQQQSLGDCIDCGLCVLTCPTGVDIREGLQMECIHCTQCADACDTVMDRVDRPRGLIRYTSQEELETGSRRFLRPRLVAYASILAVMLGGLIVSLAGKSTADVTLLRGLGSPFSVLPSGEVSNQIRLKIANRSDEERTYRFRLSDGAGLVMVAPENPLTVAPGDTRMTAAFITAPPKVFVDGEVAVTLEVGDGVDFSVALPYRLLGPAAGGGR